MSRFLRFCSAALITVALSRLPPNQLVAQTGQAPTDAASAIFLSQAKVTQKTFADLPNSAPQRTLFNLWLLDTLLFTETGPFDLAGVEEAVAGGGLRVLRGLEQSSERDVATAAGQLRLRIQQALGLHLPPAETINLAKPGQETLKDLGQIVPLRVTAGMEYRIAATGCRILRAMVVAGDRESGITGGNYFSGSLGFVAKSTETIYLRLRTPQCEGGRSVIISSDLAAVPLNPAQQASEARTIAPGGRYRGRAADRSSVQWIKLEAVAGPRYTFETSRLDSTGPDTNISVFESLDEGRRPGTQLGYDDDSALNRGARLRLNISRDQTLFLKIGNGSGQGEFDLKVTSTDGPLKLARELPVGTKQKVKLTLIDGKPIDEQWWRVRAGGQQRLVVVATAERMLDTPTVSFFELDGTRVSPSGDLDSRVEFNNLGDARDLLIQATGRPDSPYEIEATSKPLAKDLAKPLDIGRRVRMRYADSLDEHWFSLKTQPEQRFGFRTAVQGGVDTRITVYDDDGTTVLGTNDDVTYGDVSSKLEVMSKSSTLLVRIDNLGTHGGTYDLTVTPRPPPLEVTPGQRRDGRLDSDSEQWWKLNVVAGKTYTFETLPSGELDTEIILFESDGSTKIDEDDDGGTKLGSKLVLESVKARTVLLLVRSLDGSGSYRLTVSVK